MPSMISSNVIIEMIKNKVPFAFTRWGDGEWDCMLNPYYNKKNCDGHVYSPDVSVALIRTVIRKEACHFRGIQQKAMDMYGQQIMKFLSCNLDYGSWHDADIFHKMSETEQLKPFFDLIKDRRVVWIGNEKEKLSAEAAGWQAIVVRNRESWLDYSRVLQECLSVTQPDVYLFCAGFVSKVVIGDMLPFVIPHNLTLLDMGSVFDPYWGRCTRKYHKNVLEKLK